MNFSLPLPKNNLIGHRGVAGLRPENTLCSFAYAATLGLSWIEFDIQLSKDQQWIVMHDATLERTTNGHGLLRDYTAEQLVALDAGSWFKPPYPERVPTLLESLTLANDLKPICNIEIKSAEHAPELNAEAFVDFARQHQALIQNKALVSSFNLEVLVKIRALLADLPMAYINDEFMPDMINIAQEHNFYSINCNALHFSVAQLRLAQAANLPVMLFTVNDLTIGKYWIQQGVSGLFTDRADLLLAK